MKVSIMQPNIFMWNGLVKQLCDSDLHIILDHVKSSKNERYNRNKIGGKGLACWLTIPILNFSRHLNINELTLNTSCVSNSKLINLFDSRYSLSPMHQTSKSILMSTIDADTEVSAINQVYLQFLNSLKNIGLPLCKTILSSDICRQDPLLLKKKGLDLINSLLNAVSASTYLASQNTVLYAQKSDYKLSNIKIQTFSSLEYSQSQKNFSPDSFIKNLSCLDTLSYISPTEYLAYLEKSNSWSLL